MPAQGASGESSSYFFRFLVLLWLSLAQLTRRPSHSRRAKAARRSALQLWVLAAAGGLAVMVLMYAFDLKEIAMMPPRGSASLWMVRILTDFGKAEYVLSGLAGLLVVAALLLAGLHGACRVLLLEFAMRLQFLFVAVLVPVAAAAAIKWSIGRGRPFVGDHASPFNFMPFNGTEAYASFPSNHAVASFALAFAISALWPRWRVGIYVYAVAIGITRLVLLAHHPSDVLAGALIGTIGAIFVRYWFAARRLGFAIRSNGTIVALGSHSLPRLKRVARKPSAP